MREKWDLSGVSCLIVEDNSHMRTILRSVLSGFGMRTLFEAGDGAEALEFVVDRRPDIVLCDWVMSLFGGNEFLRVLRADRDRLLSTTPVLVVTAHARRSTILEAIDIGIHGFVAKPIAPVILYRHIGEVLERQGLYGRTRGIPRPEKSSGTRETDTIAPSGMAPAATSSRESTLALL
ncbi:response regulator [Roseibium marinum]|uniref:Response regulator receiver domain-containing protein n=1 Tax=Roseibium marinum TaxID=281252 RepID=A0A2S3UMY7_9HYPH|nr:response regulator [Roseibium marinum]POF28859.1 response regulator receiver domain-containing protein [Roseibium marinum]